MIDPQIVAQQIERLKGLNWFPRDNAETIADLKSSLMAAHSEAIVVMVVSDWVAESADCPKPAELRSLIWAENEKRSASLPRPTKSNYCRRCVDSGIVGGVVGGHGEARGPAKWCNCRAALDAQEQRQTLPDGRIVDLVEAHNWAADKLRSLSAVAQNGAIPAAKRVRRPELVSAKAVAGGVA
jgi:hypothetical protein